MRDLQPIYTADNCQFAYQLNWSLTLFSMPPLQEQVHVDQQLREATDADGVRILERHQIDERTYQFWISTRPR